MEGMVLFLGISVLALGYVISLSLDRIRKEITAQNKLAEENQKLYRKILSQFEITNYKEPW